MIFNKLLFLIKYERDKIKISSNVNNCKLNKCNINIKNIRYIKQAYSNVVTKIKETHHMNDIVTQKKINDLYITNHMKTKIINIIKLNKYNKLNKTKNTKQQYLKHSLTNYLGIGSKKADMLIKDGLTYVNQLNKPKWNKLLTKQAKIMIKYKPLNRIPYQNIKNIEKQLISFMYADTCIVGGFRRKKLFSRDIDVMIVSELKNIIELYIVHLKKKFSNIHIYMEGIDKASMLILINQQKKIYYKLDVFRVLSNNKYAMLLYSTGSKNFNIKMRSRAKRNGYRLNQNGLFKILENGNISKNPIHVTSEKDFFYKLGEKYIKPENR